MGGSQIKKRAGVLVALAAVLVGGCAPKEWSFDDEGAFDPIEPVNRAVYGVNAELDYFIIKPVARAYINLPPPVIKAAGNVYDNLQEPRNAVNNALQKRGDEAVLSSARFLFNSVFGIAGMFDIAEKMGVPRSETDFGQTLRAYGLNETAYIVLPVLGPSSVADAAGTGADSYLAPTRYLNPRERGIAAALRAIHRRYEFLQLGDFVGEAALDEYAFVRDVYEERRRADIEKRGVILSFKARDDGALEYVDAAGDKVVFFPARANGFAEVAASHSAKEQTARPGR